MKSIEEKRNYLESNPIFKMSLSSNELFHSNFWEWLFKRDINYVYIFFPNLKKIPGIKTTDCKVEREQENRDITIWVSGNAYIVENKFKSLPRKEQILDYQNGLGAKFISGIITGIEEPSFLSSTPGWTFCSYEFIGKQIKSVAKIIESEDSFEKELIITYAEMIVVLSQFTNEIFAKNKGKWLLSNIRKDSQGIGMDDILLKLKANELRNYVIDSGRFKSKELIGNYKLVSSVAYSHKLPIVDIRYVQLDDPTKPNIIGIQIEGCQFRWVIQYDRQMDEKEKETCFETYKNKGWFFDYDYKRDKHIIRGNTTSLTKKYGSFKGTYPIGSGKDKETKHYTFIHQYWNIPDGIPFDKLLNMIDSELERARKYL